MWIMSLVVICRSKISWFERKKQRILKFQWLCRSLLCDLLAYNTISYSNGKQTTYSFRRLSCINFIDFVFSFKVINDGHCWISVSCQPNSKKDTKEILLEKIWWQEVTRHFSLNKVIAQYCLFKYRIVLIIVH